MRIIMTRERREREKMEREEWRSEIVAGKAAGARELL